MFRYLWILALYALSYTAAPVPAHAQGRDADKIIQTDALGNKVFECTTVGEKCNGSGKTFHESTGEVKKAGTYVNGKESGPVVFYTEDGKKEAKTGQYLDGKPVGKWFLKYPDGDLLAAEVNFDTAGLKHGVQMEWYMNGQQWRHEVFDHGVATFEQVWHEDGSVCCEGLAACAETECP